jgi:hypothetical protein
MVMAYRHHGRGFFEVMQVNYHNVNGL